MSYIPRSSIPSTIPKFVKKKHTFRVFGFIATSMIVLSLVSTIGAYLYRDISLKRLDAAKYALAEISSADTSRDVKELEIFHTKLNAAEYLINNHLSPSKLFRSIEDTAKGTVQFTSLEYTYDPGFQALLELSGGTDGFMSVALQNNEFLNNPVYTEYVISDITSNTARKDSSIQVSGHQVSFTLKADLNKDMIAYSKKTAVPAEVLYIAEPVIPTTPTEEVDTTQEIVE